MTLLRGKPIVENGHFIGQAGQGTYLARQPGPMAENREWLK
jgi:hypothetical protein